MTRRPLRLAALHLLVVSALGCDGSLVNLGSSGAELSGGETGVWEVGPEPVAHADGFSVANPTLTVDEQALYFSQQRSGGNPDPYPPAVMYAARDGAGFSPGVPIALTEGDPFGVASPAIARNGGELFFSRLSDAGNADIWRSTGQGDQWTEPELVSELNSSFDDAARPPGMGDTVMPLSSKRHGGVRYQIYFARRARQDAPFGAPDQEHLAAINSAEFQSADGFLSADGCALYFSSTRGAQGDSDLFVARRADPNDDFGAPVALSDLDTPAEERMPWLSADERTLYFVSNRAPLDEYAIYVARRR